MYGNALKLLAAASVLALAFFAPAAQAGYLCEDEDGELAICSTRIPVIVPALPAELPSVSPRLGRLPSVEDVEDRIIDLKDKMCDKYGDALPDACD
jgi:hypothetical protein